MFSHIQWTLSLELLVPHPARWIDHGKLHEGLLGGSWVVISGVTSPVIWAIGIATLLLTLLKGLRFRVLPTTPISHRNKRF